MSEWTDAKIGDFLHLEPGFAFKSREFIERGIPVIKIKNVKAGYFSEHEFSYVDASYLVSRPTKVARADDLLISMSGNRHDGTRETWVGKVAHFRGKNGPYLINQRVGALRVTNDNLNPRFAGFLLSSQAYQDLFISIATSSGGQANLSPNQILGAPISLPDMTTQLAIAELLGSLDDKIELNRQTNETLEAMAQAIFRDWFVDFGPTRRKIHGATDPVEVMGGLVADPDRARELAELFPESIGDNGLPEGWDAEPLLDQAHWVNGAAYKNMHFSDAADALPVVKIAELKSGVTASTKRTNSELGERYRISNGELLFSWSGNPDTSIDAFIWTGGKAWLNQHIFAVRQNGKLSRSSLYILLKRLKPQFAEIARNKQTTGLGHVTKEDMRRLLVCVPSRDVEAAFANLAEPMVNLLISRLFEINTLAHARDFLLPKLMSGEIRLDEAQDIVEAAE